jgi:hypothetical protein
VFSCTFLAFVFEAAIRPFILSHLLLYWTGAGESEANTGIPMILYRIMNSACNSMPSQAAALSISDVLETVGAAVMHRTFLAAKMLPVLPAVVCTLLHLDSSAACESALTNALQVLVLISSVYELHTTDRNAIECGMNNVYNGNPPQRVFERVVQLLSAEYLTGFTPSFLVRHPKMRV